MRLIPKSWRRQAAEPKTSAENNRDFIPLVYDSGPETGPILDTVIFDNEDGTGAVSALVTPEVFKDVVDTLGEGEIIQLNVRDMDTELRLIADPLSIVPEDAVADVRRGPEGHAQIAWRGPSDPISFPAIDAAEARGDVLEDRTGFLRSSDLRTLIGEGEGVSNNGTGNPKDRLGDLKPDLSLNPPAALLYMSLGFKDGAVKYGPFNWRENAVRNRVYIAAAMRHIEQYRDGEDIDPLSGKPHIGHALASLAIIADATEGGMLIDDRPLPGAAGGLIRRITETGSN